ncbi:uncharacterized protein LOC113358799 isoform X2 [Papaver somniferum]|uniref:uncharacterized protein LOC113358799 isoform X2 n=1 Tax=Papaver somniferum TaxID=3469 RepID=UPI000E6FED24|nr:uncharacterized protein LOC113358799 isoform X2 [Papaver somniferum]
MVKKKTIEIQLRSSTPKKLAKASAEPNVTPRLISKATNNLNSSSRNVVLDFGDDPKPTQPTQASGGDNLHVGGSQGIVDLQNDVEQARFWTKASKKVINLEEAFKAMQESVCNLDNWGEDECHPEDAPWTQPLLYSESEDAKEWSEFCNNFKEVGPGGPSVRGDRYEFGDQEGSSEDDGYEQLLETDDEAEGDEQVVEPGLVEVGTQFSDKMAFKRHLRAYCVQHGTQYKLKKSDNLRIRAVCKFSGPPINCEWFMYARKLPNEPTFNLKGFSLDHTCIGDPLGRNSSANPEFVAQCVIEKLKTSTSSVLPKPAEIANDFWTSHNTLIPYHVAWKARNIVLEKINGSYDESYKLIPSLCEMIIRTNPGSVAKFTYGRNDNCFDSVTICFDAPMKGFINGCRPIVGLDGCHLKGKYGGCLLSATSLDAQNGLVPLGIMICRNECFENWYLFLKDLKPGLVDHRLQLNFISDRQKGLLEAVALLFPGAPHRFCIRHLSKNFKTHYKGSKLHNHFWNAARAYKEKHFKAHMDSLLAQNVDAFLYLTEADPNCWARAFFDHNSCCEHLNNNFSESFNNMISRIREKPVCKMVLMYGQLVMGMFYKRRNACLGWEDGDLVPTAKKLIGKMLKLTGEYKVEGSVAGKLYEVTSIRNTVFTVDLVHKTCSCIQWQIRGFPCQHAVCALKMIRPNWAEYCSSFYIVDNFRTTYAPIIAPLLGPDDWEEPTIVINAPILMRKPGRPRVNRRRSYDESQSKKKPRSCSKCKQTGHNKTTCGGGAVGLNPKAKRLRTEVDGQTFTSINYNHGQSRTGKRKNNGNNNINLAESSQPGGSLVD